MAHMWNSEDKSQEDVGSLLPSHRFTRSNLVISLDSKYLYLLSHLSVSQVGLNVDVMMSMQ